MSSHKSESSTPTAALPSVAELLGCRAGDADSSQWIQAMAEAGYVHLYAGRLLDAAAAFEGVMTLAPASVCGYLGLAEVRLGEGRYSEAERLARKAASLPAAEREEVAYGHRLIAKALRGAHRNSDAEAALRRAAAIDPSGAQGRAAAATLEWWQLSERHGVDAKRRRVFARRIQP
jgi:tetratricopeptide (TPR) repeat protein